uniref:PSP1 C-terminal domain-containing protein n=1 Tax=Trypanosoma congolense (strain IL3000) TaxID=1068625 RepID=G0URZ2_TRYCI|nr:conserved hypothetical protein [Trypanosoma congolense IL3000]
MRQTPLADCTMGAIQEQNIVNSLGATGAKKLMKKKYTHNPYSRIAFTPVNLPDARSWLHSGDPAFEATLFTPNRSVDNVMVPFICRDSVSVGEPCHESTGYPRQMHYSHYPATPYVCPIANMYDVPAEIDESINTSIGADRTVNLSNSTVSCCNTGNSTISTPNKRSNALYKRYVDGRPKVMRGITRAEVTVELRLCSETFLIDDVVTIFGTAMAIEDLVDRYVIVEGDRGEDLGRITAASPVGTRTSGESPNSDKRLARVLREATDEELNKFRHLDELEQSALRFCRAAVQSLDLRVPLQVERAVYQFDLKKLTFTYSSDSYVEFKSLLRTLNRQYQCRIWMHQLNWDMNCRDRRQSGNGEREGRKRCNAKSEGHRFSGSSACTA